MKMKEVTIFLNEELIKDINSIVYFLNSTEKSEQTHSIETFIIGSVIKQVHELTTYNDISGIFDEDRPYKLKNRFKEIADSFKLSQKDVSVQTGINPTTLNLIFQNKHQPSLDNFFRLWITLGYPPFSKCLYKETEEKK